MGWCSGTDIFDKVAEKLIDMKLPEEQQEEILTVLIDEMENHDWDCQSDSAYYGTPLMDKILKKLHPHWYEDEE